MTQGSRWFYLGCGHGTGHYLFDRWRNRADHPDLERLDGMLCLKNRKPYQAVVTRLPKLGYSALAWWDHSVDNRPGSNSIIFAPSPTASLSGIRTAMHQWFPWVEARLPTPLTVHPDERVLS